MGSTAALIFSLFVNFSLKQLWIFKNILQVIVLLRVLKQIPANLKSLLEALNDAVYFKIHYVIGAHLFRDYLPTEETEYTGIERQYMTKWGIEDKSYFWSLGIFAIFFIILVLLLLIYVCLKAYQSFREKTRKRKGFVKAVSDYLHKKLFYSAICRYLIESYLKIVYNTLIFLTVEAGFSSKY